MLSKLLRGRRTARLIMGLALATVTASAQTGPKVNAQVIAINSGTGVVTARDLSTGGSFEFRLQNGALLKSLKAGQQLYANFAAKQVSLDGRTVAGQIISAPLQVQASPAATNRTPGQPSTSAAAAPTGSAPAPSVRPAMRTTAASSAAQPTSVDPAISLAAPTITVGEVRRASPMPPELPSAHTRQVTALVNGRTVNTQITHLRGIDGIEQSDLPEDAKQLLRMHAQTLEPGEPDHYIVNRQLAEEWTKAHPLPVSVKQKSGGNSHAGCHALSTHCASEAAKHDEYEVERQAEALRRQALGEWKHLSDELTRDWRVASECFVDHTLEAAAVTLPPIALQPPLPPLSFSEGKHSQHAGAEAKGSVRLGLDIAAKDFQTRVDFFYVPCIPYAFRPKRIEAAGTLSVGSHIDADVSAAGQFSYLFRIPPGGGVPIELFEFPVLVAGVPVSEVRVSTFIEGDIAVHGSGSVDGHAVLSSQHGTNFKMHCDGHGCGFDSHGDAIRQAPTPENIAMHGMVRVEPSIYTAVQVDVDYDALTARGGLKPYLDGEIAGCSNLTGTATGAQVAGQNDYALTADLDWGADLIAQAYAGKKKLADQTVPLVKKNSKESHLGFWDLGQGSTALTPAAIALKSAAAGQPLVLKLRMPACYPYSDTVQYQMKWSGTAIPAIAPATSASAGISTNSPCTWQAGVGVCSFDPHKDLTLNFTWPQPGNYTVMVVPTGDKHGRKFDDLAKHTTQVAVDVQAQVARTQ